MITLSINGFKAELSNEYYNVSSSVGSPMTISVGGDIGKEMAGANNVAATLVGLLEQKATRIEFLGFSLKPSSYYVSADGDKVYFTTTGIAVAIPTIDTPVTDAAKKAYHTWSADGLARAQRAYTFPWNGGDTLSIPDTLVVNVRDILGSNPILGTVIRADGRSSKFHRDSQLGKYAQRIIFEDGLATR